MQINLYRVTINLGLKRIHEGILALLMLIKVVNDNGLMIVIFWFVGAVAK
ncbi:hypothetical protein PF005_g7699 [Phytophthora fragariae]|uniref:Uncharacterized protein n=1 Tax=Phytophthora fragariae TaxID=53985 RepID=A0A6A3YM07_9STRA|nr:hypothetical protein PF005_g7699 [Phytophthora fragariae]